MFQKQLWPILIYLERLDSMECPVPSGVRKLSGYRLPHRYCCAACRNITILNNTLANNNYAPIIVTSAVNVTVGNNTIQDALCELPSIGQGYRSALLHPFPLPRLVYP